MGAVDGTKFAYVRAHTIMQDGVKQRAYTSVLDDITVDDTEVRPWSPSQVMEPWNREQFNHFVDNYLIDVKGFEYDEMQKDILFAAMSAVQEMLEPNPDDGNNLNRMLHSRFHRYQAALANYMQYEKDPRTELSVPVGPGEQQTCTPKQMTYGNNRNKNGADRSLNAMPNTGEYTTTGGNPCLAE